MNIMILNGSLGGADGNTAKLIDRFCAEAKQIDSAIRFDIRHLKDLRLPSRADLEAVHAFLFTSGTYWDSWGSPLQNFLEQASDLEGDPCWLGKPAAVLTTMHSVGGKEVSSRLQGVINTFGLFVPPMSAMTYSFANQVALASGAVGSLELDLWCEDDLAVLAANLISATRPATERAWKAWPVDRDDPKRVWVQPGSN